MNNKQRTSTLHSLLLPILALLGTPSLLYAHVGIGQTSGFMSGLLHPLNGFDHIAAMVAVGLWATQNGSRSVWAVPLVFVTAMAGGGLWGALGMSLPLVELGIMASVLILGGLIVAAIRVPLVASSLLVALFAVCHGHAHGTEMPETASGLHYGVAFMLATAGLHGCGIGLGLLAQRRAHAAIIRAIGGLIAAFGMYLCLG